MFDPVATYRIQFHKGFTFSNLENIIPYLKDLGISTIYASPIFKAVPGSIHGYDGVNPNHINPEIGTLGQLRKLSKKLKKAGIGWIQDIVPNHMAYHPDNLWLMDVLEKGSLSVYHDFFDQDFNGGLDKDPLMAPFLAKSLQEAINNGDIAIAQKNECLLLNCYGGHWPIAITTYPLILSNPWSPMPPVIAALLAEIPALADITDAKGFSQAVDEWKHRFAHALKAKATHDFVEHCLAQINADKNLLLQLANSQNYRLCHWQETEQTINYRRFFTVNGLIGLNIHHDRVFQAFHKLTLSLVGEGIFDGLRIDHIDGLYDPEKYLRQLRGQTGEDAYIVVEKILEPHEEMPPGWPIQGNTGYDFLASANNVLTNRHNKTDFTQFYKDLTGNEESATEQITEKKRLILNNYMQGELNNLSLLLGSFELISPRSQKKIPAHQIKTAITEFLIACPVYRFYGNNFPLTQPEHNAIRTITGQIREKAPEAREGINLLERVLLKTKKNAAPHHIALALHFYRRLMQLTGPLMAKGVEDTLMYTYNRFVDHNEVGDAPDAFGITTADFHREMGYRQKNWPMGMNATATHDAKRGEDVRARLNVLSNIPGEWVAHIQYWFKINAGMKHQHIPDLNDEYLIYQTLIGTYPMPGEDTDGYADRIGNYVEKAIREAKQHTNWANPDTNYEGNVKQFIAGLLNKEGLFWKSFVPFHHKVANFGVLNSLVQTLLKFTCPGIPDVYRGCEHWDLSMVDPDNRRPVNYGHLANLLAKPYTIGQLWENRFNGGVKLAVTRLLLHKRRQNPLLFSKGSYLPLKVKGKYRDNLLAYARRYQNTTLIIVVPLNPTNLPIDWEGTRVVMPNGVDGPAESLLHKQAIKLTEELMVASLFAEIPVALIESVGPDNGRGAGVLMPISSLPSKFGIGDLGPAAREFARLLRHGGQRYWQLLPLNPVSAPQNYSPYSTHGAFAGNELLISPQDMVNEGLLDEARVQIFKQTNNGQIDYPAAQQTKDRLNAIAWLNYNNGAASHLKKRFMAFCRAEAYWLNDYALYMELKAYFNGAPWYQWPAAYRDRYAEDLRKFKMQYGETIKKTKWLQFIFVCQWRKLKSYCQQLDIKIIGDLPFYLSHDSADVWTNPKLFSLNEDGTMKNIAGVPPDYFNANGQLWHMPVFNWDKIKQLKFNWWVKRIRKNMQFFDLLRLDHFRAFTAYWAVPQGETTAINGTWKKVPGQEMFNVLKKEFKNMPFIAEDLGDIDEAVYSLRDGFNLPGMKVLQFAFGDNMPTSPYIPHNYQTNFIVYTGTHDNNTVSGWYRQEANKTMMYNIEKYTNTKADQRNICKLMVRMAMASVAKIAIIPLQDWLELDQNARMNTPAGDAPNWAWAINNSDLTKLPIKRMKDWARLYGRANPDA
jgi:malto-oligosyltrehalose synthase/4-alpha-glucanotransferase